MHSKMLQLVLLILIVGQALTERCRTPDNEEGRCLPLLSCPELTKAFANPMKGGQEYLKQFICQNDKEIEVCCDSSLNSTIAAKQQSLSESAEEIGPKILLKDALECTYVAYSVNDDFISKIRVRNLESNAEFTKCVGSLINPRYVLTAAECIVQKEAPTFSLVGVRFEMKDKSFKDYGVEEQIPHPFHYAAVGINDIALLRLNATVVTESIRPACMLLSKYSYLADPGNILITYGGLHTSSEDQWLDKATVRTTVISSKNCKQMFDDKNEKSFVTDFNKCTTDMKNSTLFSCNSYPGVPLFTTKFLSGISSSRTICSDGLPDVYTDVASYTDWIIDNMRPWFNYDDPCVIINGEEGNCRSLFYCPTLMKTVAIAKNDLKKSKLICDQNESGSDLSVCCDKVSNLTTRSSSGHTIVLNNKVPEQYYESKLCGIQHRDDYFALSENITIDEFPWIALIANKTEATNSSKSTLVLACTGTLINSRYVLTVISCVKPLSRSNILVRLGDFYNSNKTDCVKDLQVDATDCNVSEDFRVDEKIIHPYYIDWTHVNDIALLRLNATVVYTDFIRPICLPFQASIAAKPGDVLYMSSWGTNLDYSYVKIKKKVLTTLITNNECTKRFRKLFDQEVVTPFSMCTEDSINNTEFACTFDEGAPLMFNHNYRWQIEGILTSGESCGQKPVKYTKVAQYLDWIRHNMRPWTKS